MLHSSIEYWSEQSDCVVPFLPEGVVLGYLNFTYCLSSQKKRFEVTKIWGATFKVSVVVDMCAEKIILGGDVRTIDPIEQKLGEGGRIM